MHNLDIIKQRVQIEDLAERFGIQIANHKAKCPFHEDQDPSLQFYPDSNSFYCFGCATGGDIFNFIMLKVRLSDNDAIVFDKQRVIEVLCFTLVNQLVPPP